MSREGSLEEEGPRTKKGLWRTALLRGSSWLGGQRTAEPKAGPFSPREATRCSGRIPQDCHPPPGTSPAGLHRRLRCLPGRAAKTCSGPWAPSPRWGHLRLLGRTEAAEGGGNRGTFWMRPSMSR